MQPGVPRILATCLSDSTTSSLTLTICPAWPRFWTQALGWKFSPSGRTRSSSGPTRTPVGTASGRSKPAYWATVQEIRKRTGILTGRQDELARIASFAAGDEGYRWLVGQAWAGKTALLAEAVTTLPGDVDVVCYFLSRREADADSSRFLAAVVPQLASLLDEDPPAADSHQFRALWQRAAERADTGDRHLLLAVDGLDEDLRPPGLPVSRRCYLPALAAAFMCW